MKAPIIEEVKMSQDFFFKMNDPANFEKMKQNQQEFDNMIDKHYGAMHGNQNIVLPGQTSSIH